MEPKVILESLLFIADEPVEIDHLVEVLGLDKETIAVIIEELAKEYSGRGIRLQRLGGKIQMVSAPEAAPYVERFLETKPARKLSQAALETLAIIAYLQPITRAQIEAIRGVNSDGVIRSLLSKGLIEEVGHLDSPGRPALYGTTFQFLKYFGLERLEDLPPLEGENA
ncbi:MAG: SMC-Scp complex subunit ScpB [Anaerolineae bacterium]|nr:SMC-Scp complex subunit ScpB [Anaerolineae bacterium]MDW8102970.1 SMC-Scp complex subunit ScpB [Anaerolineae bacterium]